MNVRSDGDAPGEATLDALNILPARAITVTLALVLPGGLSACGSTAPVLDGPTCANHTACGRVNRISLLPLYRGGLCAPCNAERRSLLDTFRRRDDRDSD